MIVKISKIIAPPLKRVTAHVVEIKTLQDVASVRDDIGFLRSTFTLKLSFFNMGENLDSCANSPIKKQIRISVSLSRP